MKHKDKLIIFDTTLRDGEQSAGVSIALMDKIAIAEKLDAMKVDVIEAGFAAASSGALQAVQGICKVVKDATVCCLARAKTEDIKIASLALKLAVKPRIHTFFSTSARHLQYQFAMTNEEALELIKSSVRTARHYCDDVKWTL